MDGKNSVYQNHSLKLRSQQINRLRELLLPKMNTENNNYLSFNKNTLQIDPIDQLIDIKQLSRELAKLLESNQETIEEELRQVAISKNIKFDDFKAFQKEFIAQLYSNPSHPLDMQVSQLNEIRKDFEEAALRAKDKNSSNEGIPIDGFSQILARKMNMDPSRIQKFLQRSAFFNQITWNEFQSMLDKESTIRDQLLDWFMHKESPSSLHDQNEYSLEEKIEHHLKPKERTSQRVFMIENLIEMKVDKRNYLLVIFDESTIAIYQSENYQSVLEFVIPYDPSQTAVQEKSRKNKQTTATNDDSVIQEDYYDTAYDKNNQSQIRIRETPKKRQSTTTTSKRQGISNSGVSQDLSYYNVAVDQRQQKSVKKQNLFDEISMYDDQRDRRNIMMTDSSNYNQKETTQRRSMTANSRQKRLADKINTHPINASIIKEQYSLSDINSSQILQKSYPSKPNNNNNIYSNNNKMMSLNESIFLPNTKRQQTTVNQKNGYYNRMVGQVSGQQQHAKQDRSRSMNQSIFSMNTSVVCQQRQEGERRNLMNQNSLLQESRQDQSYLISTNYQSQRVDFKRTASGIMAQQQQQQQQSNTRKFNQSASMRMNESIISLNSQTANRTKLKRDSLGNRDERREGNVKNNNIFLDENLYKMEEDPDFYKIIKIYLTSEIKDDDDKKRILISFEQFYNVYKRDPTKYPYNGLAVTPTTEINTKTCSKEHEEYISKDSETKDVIRKLWKKFYQLPRDFSIGYAKAVNEIINERNLKNINHDNLKIFFKKSLQGNTTAPKASKNQQIYLSKTQSNQRKRPGAHWKSEQCKKYLKDIKDIDQHININPWSSELRKRPERQMPVFLKEIQQEVEQKIEEKQIEKAKNGNKRQSYQNEYQDELGAQDNYDEGNVKNSQITKNRNNRMKTFSIEYLADLSILAMGMINRQLQIYYSYHEKNQVQMRRVYSHQFNDCIISIQFRLNIVTKKWNIALLFENNILRVYEFIFNSREQKISTFEHFFTYEFRIEIDRMKMFNEFGFVLTSYKGEFFIFSDHLTSNNSSDEVKSVPQYYIDQENKLQENGIALSITSMACCEVYKVIIFGTSKGKIAFYEVKTREFLGINEAGDDIILDLHVYKQQNQLISICKNTMVTVWDIARRVQIQSLRGIDDRMDVGNAKITTSHFTHQYNQLMVAANSLKIWQMSINKNLLFKERKMQQLYEWRKKDMEKQDNYLLMEGVKSNLIITPDKKKTNYQSSNSSLMKKGLINLKNTVTETKMNIQKEVVIIKQAILTKDVLVTWNSDSEIRIICSKKYKLKYSFMLSAPEDDKIEYLDILDDKILAMCTEKGDIYIKNLYTEDLCQKISEYDNYPLKLNILLFLPQDCQMFLAVSSLEGKVMFFNSYLKKKTSNKFISINAHTKDVISMVSNNCTIMVSAGIDNIINIYSLRSCSSLYRVDFSTLASKQYIYDVCIQKERGKEKSIALVLLEKGQIYELNCNDGMVISSFRESVGIQSKCQIDSQSKQIMILDENFNIKLFQKTMIQQLLAKHLSMNLNHLSQSPTKFTNDFNNYPSLFNNKSYSKQFLLENDKWNPSPQLLYSLKNEPIFAKCKDPELACVKILYDENSQFYYIFLNQIAAVLVNVSNPKEHKMRYYFYATGELSAIQKLNKQEESSNDSQQIDIQSENSINLM